MRTLTRLALVVALLSPVLVDAALGMDATGAGGSECTYRQGSDSDGGCREYYTPGGNCTGCCKHKHLTLSWSTCEPGGLSKIGTITKKYFQAKLYNCFPECTLATTKQCEHSVDNCTTAPCETPV